MDQGPSLPVSKYLYRENLGLDFLLLICPRLFIWFFLRFYDQKNSSNEAQNNSNKFHRKKTLIKEVVLKTTINYIYDSLIIMLFLCSQI